MSNWEYKAVPAPAQGTKAKGVRATPDRFALSVTNILNEMSGDGWEYLSAEALPCEERRGLTGRDTTIQNVLIFRRWTGPSPLQTMVERRDTQPPLTLDDPYIEDQPGSTF